MIGIDPDSDGLRRAADPGVATSSDGVDWLLGDRRAVRPRVRRHLGRRPPSQRPPVLRVPVSRAIDLTPAQLGPAVVPPVNLDDSPRRAERQPDHLRGPGHHPDRRRRRQGRPGALRRDRLHRGLPLGRPRHPRRTSTSSPRPRRDALVEIGGAAPGKAIIVLNPADPPILMRNTVFCALADGFDDDAVTRSILRHGRRGRDATSPATGSERARLRGRRLRHARRCGRMAVVVLLEVEGAGDFLPPFAGNLDIMTAAAVRVGEHVADRAGRCVSAARIRTAFR